jgi:hypothetical protein
MTDHILFVAWLYIPRFSNLSALFDEFSNILPFSIISLRDVEAMLQLLLEASAYFFIC